MGRDEETSVLGSDGTNRQLWQDGMGREASQCEVYVAGARHMHLFMCDEVTSV